MAGGCPFHSHSGGVALGELPGIVRCGDRVRLFQALNQLETSLAKTQDLDEARSVALTFTAMVTAATLEMGASRSLHRIQLELAREVDQLATSGAIATAVRNAVLNITNQITNAADQPSAALIDRALRLLNKRYMEDLNDDLIAGELGLSTSHFRHLFRQATGQPFHKYLIALRLEAARRMLLDGRQSVSDVALSVGFSGLAHFSRAFSARFSVRPSDIRRGGQALAVGAEA